MTKLLCVLCNHHRACLKRPKTGQPLCRQCFFHVFESEIHHTITSQRLFERGARVVIGASGGKDSTVLAHIMTLLNQRHDYGLDLQLLSIDEGIDGYRNDSLETVKRNQQQYQLPLTILSYKELYGWSMDDIVRAIGKKNNCTFCGVFRRQALERGALQLGAQHIVTGHNADDIAETVLMNLLRGDISRLERCTLIQSQLLSERSQTPAATATGTGIQRSKPFKYTYEKEIVMYAYFLRLDYFSTECTYAPNAYRGTARTYLKSLEKIRPSVILDIIYAGESMQVKRDRAVPRPKEGVCERCGFVASQRVCKACVLLEGLNRGLPKLGIGRAARKVGLETEEVGERKVVEEMEKMTLKDISKEF